MGDRCYLEMTMRRGDLPRFAPHVGAAADERWWTEDEPDAGNPDLVRVRVHEAEYGWFDEREAAAKAGIPFIGTHGQGGEYGSHAFVSWAGRQLEAPTNRDGDMVVAINEALVPIETRFDLYAYVETLRAARDGLGLLLVAA